MNEKTCRVCGTPFKGRANRLYCSPACKWQAFAQRHRRNGVDAHPLPVVACGQCGQDFQPKNSRAHFCSNRCRQAAYRARRLEWQRRTLGRRPTTKGK